MNRLILILLMAIVLGCPAQAEDNSQKVQQAKKVLEDDFRDRKAQAEKELAAILKKYKLKLAVSVLITESGNQPQLILVTEN